MHPLLRNVLALVAGVIAGGIVNMAIVMLGPMIVPLPPGIDPKDPESLARGIALMGPQHFLMPFLAHALGTLVGALVAWKLAATRRALLAYLVGVVFLIGGGVATAMIPSAPTWFVALDLLVAYLPMSWLATRIGERTTAGRTRPPARGR